MSIWDDIQDASNAAAFGDLVRGEVDLFGAMEEVRETLSDNNDKE